MGFAQQAGGSAGINELFQMGQQQQAANQQASPQASEDKRSGPAPAVMRTPENSVLSAASQKPAAGWTCPGCGTLNKGKFCSECGSPKPAGALLYRCDKCGWEPRPGASAQVLPRVRRPLRQKRT